MTPQAPELVVFDLAGTLIEDDAIVARCLVEALRTLGVDTTLEFANAVMGLRKPDAIRSLLERAGRRADETSLVAGVTAFERAIVASYESEGEPRAVEGSELVLRTLRERGIHVAVDSGFSRTIVEMVLARLGWQGTLVETFVGSDEVERGRPAPDLIYEAMRRTDTNDVRCVAKVGDTPFDLLEGARAGCGWNVGVTYGTHERAALRRYRHTALIDDLRELLNVLRRAEADDVSPLRRA